MTHLETPGLCGRGRGPADRSHGVAPGIGLDDSVYQRLLRERIIFLGPSVDDAIANAICAQLLLLAAEDPGKDI